MTHDYVSSRLQRYTYEEAILFGCKVFRWFDDHWLRTLSSTEINQLSLGGVYYDEILLERCGVIRPIQSSVPAHLCTSEYLSKGGILNLYCLDMTSQGIKVPPDAPIM